MGWSGFGKKEPPSPPPLPPSVAPVEARETPADPPKERGPYFPDALATSEQELINTRRAAIGQEADTPPIGVGLSGGGIRSATFCFGIFTALARKFERPARPLFTRIDYLSTVSGGGYFGSFLGALFRRHWVKSADDVATVLRDELGPEGRSVADALPARQRPLSRAARLRRSAGDACGDASQLDLRAVRDGRVRAGRVRVAASRAAAICPSQSNGRSPD